MKYGAPTVGWLAAITLAAGLAVAGVSHGAGPGAPVSAGAFVETQGSGFLLDGRPFHFVGADCYYLMTLAAEPSLRLRVDEVLREAVGLGLGVIRTWAFNDGTGWNPLQTAPGVYDERVFQGLDYVVQKCDSLGLRVVLPLVNNWVDYGGMDQYVAWSPTATTHDDFYTDASCRGWYKEFAATVLARYAGNPVILAWELANEPRCASDPTGNTLQAWIGEMSSFLKALDPDHLVTTGGEGFFADPSGPWYLNGSEGVNFLRNHAVPWVDFAVAHNWPDSWGMSDAQALDLLGRQLDVSARILGKPFVLEEFGKPRDGVSVRAPAHYDPRTYFAPGVRPYAVPGASPVTVDAERRAVAYAAPEIGEAAPAPGVLGTTTERDRFFGDAMARVFSHGGDGAAFWILLDDAAPDGDGYGVYAPADGSTLELIRSFAMLTAALDDSTLHAGRPLTQLGVLSPNPFTGDLTVPVTLSPEGILDPVRMTVVDVAGRLVRVLLDGRLPVGTSSVVWDGRTESGQMAASGVYRIVLRTGNEAHARSAVRLR